MALSKLCMIMKMPWVNMYFGVRLMGRLFMSCVGMQKCCSPCIIMVMLFSPLIFVFGLLWGLLVDWPYCLVCTLCRMVGACRRTARTNDSARKVLLTREQIHDLATRVGLKILPDKGSPNMGSSIDSKQKPIIKSTLPRIMESLDEPSKSFTES